MKSYAITAAMVIVCGFRLWAQEPSVGIRINDEERFRFDSIRMAVINPGYHVMIGDSTGMDPNGITNTSYNTFIGHKSGRNNNGGNWNTFIGAQAGEDHRWGDLNLFVGAWAGRFDTAGRMNAFIGTDAGAYNKTGQKNTFVGYAAGAFCDSGFFNTSLGYWSGGYMRGGQENVFLGFEAGRNSGKNGSAYHNTYVGAGAGRNNEYGNDNVFIGYQAGMNDDGFNRLHIANNPDESLIYGEFDNRLVRFNANRMEIRNALENTIIGDSAGYQAIGNQNVVLGRKAGISLRGGYINTFLGYGAGLNDTSGYGNVFVGMLTGWQNTTGWLNVFVGTNAGFANTTGRENTYLGTSAGGNNATGNFNTCLGRRAGLNNETGSGNVFLGYYAGANETGSNKLYISNSPDAPLIYGDFEVRNVIFNAAWIQVNGGSVHASHEIETDWHYVAAGNPGITDTVNNVTEFDFAQQKLKYRTTVYTGGIVTFISLPSDWVNAVGDFIIPCGEISIVGELNDWTGDIWMRRNAYNYDIWTLTLKLTIEDDHSVPVDSIVEMKFREDGDWTVSWGSTSFPSGTGTNQYGQNIPVPLDDDYDTTIYYVTFNCRTGEYTFSDMTGYCGDSITDGRDGKKYATILIGNQCWMAQDLNVGTRIDAGTDQTDNALNEKYCYDNLETNCDIWGGLYQWPELMQYVTTPGTQGICPVGFHVPTDTEFKTLEGNVDSQYGSGSPEWDGIGWRGFDAGLNLRSTDWANGTDAFGFHAVPGGIYSQTAGFGGGGCCPNYQTSDSDTGGNPWIRHLNGDFPEITRNTNSAADGCTLRCVKD